MVVKESCIEDCQTESSIEGLAAIQMDTKTIIAQNTVHSTAPLMMLDE